MKYISIIFLLSFIALSTNSSAQSENYNPLPVSPQVKKYDVPALFPGGSDLMFKFFNDSCKVFLTKNYTEQKAYVLVKFIIDKKGKAGTVRIVNGVAGQPQLVKEAIRLVEIMPAWTPATLSDKPVEYEVNLSMPFFKE
jgi:hypothetical protein